MTIYTDFQRRELVWQTTQLRKGSEMGSPFFDGVNQAIDYLVIGLIVIGAIVWNARYLISSINKEIEKETKQAEKESKRGQNGQPKNEKKNSAAWVSGMGKALYIWVIFALAQLFVVFIFWVLPIRLAGNTPKIAEVLRWAELYIFLSLLAYVASRKYSKGRGLYSMLGHLTILVFGWLVGRWFGVAFFSIPMLAIYYHLIYRFAEVIIPASNPEDRREKLDRFKILAAYIWGVQSPILVVDDQTSMKAETRIDGDKFQDYPIAPGYIWTPMPQAIGITNGTNFARVAGPGAVYTKKYERPLDVIDLRTQLRTAEIDAITQDGIPIKAIVFMAFRVDNTNWDRDLYNQLRIANPLLRGGIKPDQGNSHFQYSCARVRTVLSMEGVRTNVEGPIGTVSWRWDEQVVYLISEAARRVISETPLSELWVPNHQNDGKGISALDLIADRIRDENNSEGLFYTLRKNGVLLFAARVVNYNSYKDHNQEYKFGEFTRQQIPVWRERWKQRINQKLAEANAEAERKQLDATTLARSTLLTSIAESLQKVSASNTDLARYLIAMRFLGTLDHMISEEPALASNEKGRALRERISLIRNFPRYSYTKSND